MRKLETIGIRIGHLDSSYNPKHSQPSVSSSPQHSSLLPKITHSELSSAAQDDNIFYELCVRIAFRAMDMYTKAERHRFALRIRGILAAINL